MEQQSIEYLLPFALYAETHFRFFRWMPSLLFKQCPEILFDCPRRIDPQSDLPVTLIINDTAGSTVNVNSVSIAVNQIGATPLLFSFSSVDQFEVVHDFQKNQQVYIILLKREELPDGIIFINCKAGITYKKHRFEILNDNFFSSSNAPLTCFVSDKLLPGSCHCSYGDMHFHSQYSQSHVEFGPPLEAVDRTARASGLDFVAITDHSYDLACSMENYLTEDLSLKRWNSLQKELRKCNWSTTFLPGEEVSCLNNSGSVIHLCAIGIKDYIPGSMDGARKKKLNKSELTIKETVASIKNQGAIAYAAHPGSKKTIMQYIFLNRGIWTDTDISERDLCGVQAFNGSYKMSWERAQKLWVDALIRGQKLALIAGNDAHGDFNRYRAIKVPFVSLLENDKRYIGFGKTGVYSKDCMQTGLIDSIRSGRTFITTGPFLSICFSDDPSDCAVSFDKIPKCTESLFVHAESTEEFGVMQLVKALINYRNSASETVLFSKTYTDQTDTLCEQITLDHEREVNYIRAYAVTRLPDNSTRKAFTGACYFH